MKIGARRLALWVLCACLTSAAQTRPTIFLIGDSTVNNHTAGQLGWGDPFSAFFDMTKVSVENRARGGRSSRTFLTEGLWDQILSRLQPGDFVLMQFGHNDGGSLTEGRGRASLKGVGEETQEITNQAGAKEVVHTFGWYMRRYVADTKAKGATPVVLSPVPRNMWRVGKVLRASNDYGKWAAEAAKAGDAAFIDLNDLVARRYEQIGQEEVSTEYFGVDHTHTTVAGARVNATAVVEGLKGLKGCAVCPYLSVQTPAYQFDFGSAKAKSEHIQVLAATVYSKERGHGFEQTDGIICGERSCTADRPFFFSVALPEGNYNVTVVLGDPASDSNTTVKAESRRLMLETVKTAPGAFATRTFTVNIRTPKIATGGEVKLKDREIGVLHWDDKLTLEFNGARPRVSALEIVPSKDAVTLYLMGDSTVTDQTKEPWNSWGQMLPRFFKAGVAVANHAESGESLRSSLSARRLDKVMSVIQPGDYLFIQFGHNDQKERGEGVGAFMTYKADLKRYVAEARQRDAIPVLITSMHRRTFEADGTISNSLGDYPEAVRQVAKEENIALIDLHAMSKPFYEALGPENSKKAFVDNTHHNNYGSYELAKCVVEGIKANRLGLVRFLVPEALTPFDPGRPDPIESFGVPASPLDSVLQDITSGTTAILLARRNSPVVSGTSRRNLF